MKFVFILLLMALTLIFPINVSMAENNNFIKSLTGFQWSMGLSLTSDEVYVVDGLYNKILVFSKSDIEKNISDFTDYKDEYFLNENKCVGHVHGISVVDEKIYAVKNNFDCIAVFDCNENCIEDAIDIAQGTSNDENNDGIPDECGCFVKFDCNENCIEDAIDIAEGTSSDVDNNGIPELRPISPFKGRRECRLWASLPFHERKKRKD